MKKNNKVVKIDWGKELRSTHSLNNIDEILNTYWDEDYKLWKIRKVIARWRGKEIEEIMEADDPLEYYNGRMG